MAQKPNPGSELLHHVRFSSNPNLKTMQSCVIFQTKKKCSKQIEKRFEKMPRTNDTSFSFRGQSYVHAEQCIGRAANQYSYLTYTAWVEILYTAIGRTAILLSLHERNYDGTLAKYAFRCVTHSVQLQYQYRIVTTGILLN